MKKLPIWSLLVERELVDDRKAAEAWLMAGKVTADSIRVDKPGQLVPANADIVVRGLNQRYVGKGGLKLEGALADFGASVEGVVAIDAGAARGGFTDCLLQHGAARVYAIDAGFGQLAGKLHIDPRVVAMEKVSISQLDPEALDPKPTLAVMDLSYVSLRLSIPMMVRLLDYPAEMICLVKPQYEASETRISRAADLESAEVYRQVLRGLACFLDEQGYSLTGITHSHITGNNGNREFFIHVLPAQGGSTQGLTRQQIDSQIEQAIAAALELNLFKRA